MPWLPNLFFLAFTCSDTDTCNYRMYAMQHVHVHVACTCVSHTTCLYVGATPLDQLSCAPTVLRPTVLRTDRPADGRPHADPHANTHARPTCAPTEPARLRSSRPRDLRAHPIGTFVPHHPLFRSARSRRIARCVSTCARRESGGEAVAQSLCRVRGG